MKIALFGKEFAGTTEDAARELDFDRVSKVHQIHGNVIHVVHDQPLNFETQGDGLITNLKNHALSVRFADCQGFIVYAPEKEILGVLHAGWRGMAVHAIKALYAKMKEDFGIEPKETFVGITPSICAKCYRFKDAQNRLPKHLHPFISDDHLDLMAAADAELDAIGVPREQRERHPECTSCGIALSSSATKRQRSGGEKEPNTFWSWRKDKKEDARNYLVAGIWQENSA